MRLDLLTILLPKSLDMGSIGSGKSHDSITPQEVSTILAYANLNEVELNLLMGKYLEDESARHDLIKHAESFVKTEDELIAKKIAHTGVVELFTDTTCFFCNGVGIQSLRIVLISAYIVIMGFSFGRISQGQLLWN